LIGCLQFWIRALGRIFGRLVFFFFLKYNVQMKYDIIFVLPYRFSDHPSFPEGILKRALEADGFSVGFIETPFWQEPESFSLLGEPNLFFAIIPGPVDSVVLNYTSTRKRRIEDLYQEKGRAYFEGYPPSIKYKIRPDRTVVVFANRIRQQFKSVPIVIGGIEATLRRFAHYDFQEEKIKRSILLDTRADIMVTGMGELQLLRLAQEARAGAVLKDLDLPGTARMTKDVDAFPQYGRLPDMAEILAEPGKLMEAELIKEQSIVAGRGVVQPHEGRFIIQHPAQSYTVNDINRIYGYSFSRSHLENPGKKNITPALLMNLFSVTSHRGCGGGCSFCSISAHEGKRILPRSQDSILAEIENFNHHPQWRGIVSDIGGGTAEMYGNDCDNLACRRTSCLIKETCETVADTGPYLNLLRQAREIKGVKQIFLGSGIRYDLMVRNPVLLEEILRFHCGRFLRTAPEHTEDSVLDLMRKPRFEAFEEFMVLFNSINWKLKRKIQMAPYLIVGHPGETMKDVYNMRDRLNELKLETSDVQIFTPTPGTLSTAMYYSGLSPSLKPIPVERNVRELMKRKNILTPQGHRPKELRSNEHGSKKHGSKKHRPRRTEDIPDE